MVAASCVGVGFAQNTNSGDVRGTVTDSTGAVISGVTVTVKDVDKGGTRTYTTDGAGLYDTGSIVPDHYLFTFTKAGFSTFIRGPVTVQVGTNTIDAKLDVGAATQQVVVTTDLPLLSTESGSQTSTLNAKTLEQLPEVGADWQNFVKLLPGASGVVFRTGQTTSVNGNLPYNTILADGATSTLPMSENATVSVLETVSELKIDDSAFSAQYGIGGVIFNQISKGGTNQFHGVLYEYFQNNALNAAPYAFGQKAKVPVLRYNNFGGTVGGPIIKDKMFFFFDYDKTLQFGGAANGFISVPTAAMRNGDFTGQPTIYDPTTQTVDAAGVVHRQSFASEYGNGNVIPTSMIDTVANAIQAYYPQPNSQGTVKNGQTTNNYFFNVPSSNPFTKYFGRLDYAPTAKHRIVASETEADNPATHLNEGLCPINCQRSDASSDNAQVSDVWTITPNTLNEARLGFTDQMVFYVPYSLNEGFPAKLGWKFAKADVFPQVGVYGACCYYLQPSSNSVYKQFTIDPSDVATLIRGRHVLHFGGEFLDERSDSTAWGNINAGYMQFTGVYTAATQGAANTSGVPYADFLLGKVNGWAAGVTPEWGGRLKSPQLFFQDDFKARPNLTLNLGLRFQGMTGWHEVKGNMKSFDPTVINPVGNVPGAMWYGVTHANGRNSLQAPVWSTFLPRFGFAYQPRQNLVIRGGIGLYAYVWSLDAYGNGMGGAFGSSGNLFDSTNGVSPVVQLDSDGNTATQGSKSINALYQNSPTTPDAYNGQGVGYNQYHTPVPEILQWNVSVQREVGSNMMFEVAYVASHGYNLAFPVDINQVPANKLGPNDAFGATNARPYPLFRAINGNTNNAYTNYNSLQASASRRLTTGLEFNFNYTWSHFLDVMDSSGWAGSAGNQGYQSSYDPSANYGASNFDIRSQFKGSAIYELPFGKGRRFLNNNAIVDAVIGGWQTTGIIVLHGGSPFTPVMANNLSYSQAGNQYPNLVGNPNSGAHTIKEWFNVAAYAAPANGTFGDVRRNSLYGPGFSDIDLSLGKTFHIRERFNFEVRADARNALNHASFSNPDPNIGPGHTAQITGVTNGGRTMQLYGRLSF
ncbi:MAG: carboxypeptidase-like regulatory domain-containing protein [Acidobacteriaceae bacterium]